MIRYDFGFDEREERGKNDDKRVERTMTRERKEQ